MAPTLELLAEWAWQLHHNILSWYVRPLFPLPYCWFAACRSTLGRTATLVAPAKSMAWFPAPTAPDPAVVRMLAAEREYLLGAWNPVKIVVAALVPLVFGTLAAALWRRSVGWAAVVVNGAVVFKIGWTLAVDGAGAGALADLPAALVGLVVVDLALAWWACRCRATPVGAKR